MPDDQPKLYTELASWFHLLTAPKEYAEEAVFFRKLLDESCSSLPQTLLELGSGGGNNASHLKAHYQMTLVDLSTGMLALSHSLNPECEHMQGDMRTARLGRLFDAVFLHDAISYMTNEADLRAAMQTAYLHCRPGGAALFAPDYTRESFLPSTDHGGHDGNGRGLRYLEWVVDPDPSDTVYTVNLAYLLRERDGSVRVEHDRHFLGLFAVEDWLRLLRQVGFRPMAVTAPYNRQVFVAVKPA